MRGITEPGETERRRMLERVHDAQSAKLDVCEGKRDEIVVHYRLADLPVHPLEIPETVKAQCMIIPETLRRFERFHGR